mmetsp:Transcript_19315/g.3143  ORF Transcript_19315/g.3143 Transcript_19315/m.3143 type:complete len:99 (-) Transcript_19315:231-527(-)
MNIPIEQGYFNYSEGESLFYMISGPKDAPPLILLHGLCASGLMFYTGIPALSKNYRVYTIDLLGMGKSSRPNVKFNSREESENFFTRGIIEFIENFNL